MSGPFDLAAQAKAVHATLEEAYATIPEGRHNVFILDGTYSTDDGPRARFIYARKVADGWNIELAAEYDKPHGASGKVATIKSW